MASRKNRRASAAVARKNKKPAGGQKATLAQITSMLEGLEGMGDAAGDVAVKLEPMMVQVDLMSAELKVTQEALEQALEGGKQLHAQLMQQKATFLWLIADLVDVDLEVLERRYDQGYQTLQRKR